MQSKVTTSSNESAFGDLLGNTRQFVVPPFQRPFSWKPANFDRVFKDLEGIEDGIEDVHFMGAIIMDRRMGGTTDLDRFEVIDGQQRITTIFLTVCAAVSVLLRSKDKDGAEALASKYLLVSHKGYLHSKLSPSIPDRHDLNLVLSSLFTEGLSDARSFENFQLRQLSSPNMKEGQVSKTYKDIRKKLLKLVADYEVSKLHDYVDLLLTRLTVVEIIVTDPSAGPRIFDSLNSRQVPITTGDLIRNEIFGRIAREDPAEAIRLDEEVWSPFYDSFAGSGEANERKQRDTFEKFFFPMGLILDSSLKKNEVFPFMRERWKGMTVVEIMAEMDDSRVAYQDLVFGENTSKFSKDLADQVLNFYLMGVPSAALPFLMKVIQEVREERLTEKVAISLIKEVETFLVRRAICSIEPTGLHAVFKGLWQSLGDKSPAALRQKLGDIKTVEYPDDEKVKSHLDAPLYGKNIDKFFIWSFEKSLPGDKHTKQDFAEHFWIEHVLPQSLPNEGWESFTKQRHSKLVHLAGNLIPLTRPMNIQNGVLPYGSKSKKIRDGSKYSSARKLVMENKIWGEEEILKRNEELKAWAVSYWAGLPASE